MQPALDEDCIGVILCHLPFHKVILFGLTNKATVVALNRNLAFWRPYLCWVPQPILDQSNLQQTSLWSLFNKHGSATIVNLQN